MIHEGQLLKELRTTLSKMELSLDVIDDAIVWINDKAIIKWSNDKFANLVNMHSIEILDNSIENLLKLKFNKQSITWKELLKLEAVCARSCIFELNYNDAIKYLEVSARKFQKLKYEENIIIIIHDVTEKHLNEEKLIEANKRLQEAYQELTNIQLSQAKLAAIVENTDDAIISRTLDGRVDSWNRGAERLYGYKAEEVIGKSAIFIYPPNRINEFYYSTEVTKKGEHFAVADSERIHRDGHIFPVSVIVSPIRDKQNNVVGACSIARDISELKTMLNIKNDFISTVSHELRTPLTSIQGAFALLLSGAGGELSDKANKLLQIGKVNSERLLRLINDMLDIQKIEAGKVELHRETIEIGDLVHDALIVNQVYADQHQMEIILDKKCNAKVDVDKDRILQVLSNLISNAIKFSTQKKITINVLRNYNYVRVEVVNLGEGIPVQFRKHIFQKFSQADSASSVKRKTGTGLGLSISKEIIEKHGGKIGFTSKKNAETIFFFDLPIFIE